MRQADRYKAIIERFAVEMPTATTELNYRNPYELLVAVILSAQCTDKRVNMITPSFFDTYPTIDLLAKASQDDIYQLIKSCSYPNNKAKSLLGMARKIVNDYNSEVPDDMDSLLTIPGVGRKTANVILSVIYQQPAMAVDTHVFRVSERLGLTTRSRNPLMTERKLVENIPADLLGTAHHWLILHGRYVCKARVPLCNKCFLSDLCRYKNNKDKAEQNKVNRIKSTAKPI